MTDAPDSSAHVLRTTEEPQRLVAVCSCGAPLLSIDWTGADREATVARFRAGAEDGHRRHVALEVAPQPLG